jgi:hypothetical protein
MEEVAVTYFQVLAYHTPPRDKASNEKKSIRIGSTHSKFRTEYIPSHTPYLCTI